MKNKVLLSLLSALLITLLPMVSCRKVDYSKVASAAWAPEVAVPLATASYSVYDILTNQDSAGLLTTDSDGAVILAYGISQDLITAGEYLVFPDQSENFSEDVSDYSGTFVPFLPYTGDTTLSINEEIDFNNDQGAEIYSIDFSDGEMTVSARTDLQHDVQFDITFPDLLNNGVPVNVLLDLTYDGSIPAERATESIVDLSNSNLDLSNGGTTFNKLRMNADITVTSNNNNPITGTESFDFGMSIADPTFDLITGYFGTQELFSYADTIGIRLFDKFVNGQVQFTNPTIDLAFHNSFGLPIQLNFNQVKTIEDDGNSFQLSGAPTDFTIEASPAQGTTQTSELSLNSMTTNNIGSIISPTPKDLIFDLGSTLNPDGPTTNFISADSKLSADINLTMPLEGYAFGFLLRDTIDVDLNLPEQLEEVSFRFGTNNGFPTRMGVRMFMVDENYDLLFELTDPDDNLFMIAAPVDVTGEVTESAEKITDVTVAEEDLEKLSKVKHLVIEATGRTLQADKNLVVKIFDYYKLDLKIGMTAKGAIKL